MGAHGRVPASKPFLGVCVCMCVRGGVHGHEGDRDTQDPHGGAPGAAQGRALPWRQRPGPLPPPGRAAPPAARAPPPSGGRRTPPAPPPRVGARPPPSLPPSLSLPPCLPASRTARPGIPPPASPRPSPPEHSAQQGGVEALGRRQASLHFRHRDLVLGGGAEQREAARHRAEDLVGVHHPAEERVLVDGDGGDGVVVRLGEGHGACREGGAGR